MQTQKMFGILFGKGKDPWEELYDFDTNTYFYRHRGTGEFARNHPLVKESTSSHVPSRCLDPLWETMMDPETGQPYWTDLETGKVCYLRPEKGTFITEVPLKDFRKAGRIMQKQSSNTSSRRSTRSNQPARKSLRTIRRNDDFGIVSGDTGDVNFEELFGTQSPAQFDAGAMFLLGNTSPAPAYATSPQGPSDAFFAQQSHSNSPAYSDTRRSPVQHENKIVEGNEEEEERPENDDGKMFQALDEETILAQSTISTDNPLFRYG